MAKLEGVKVIDMVDGKVTKISYEGNTYENVGNDGELGDIALRVRSGDPVPGLVTVGSYYKTELIPNTGNLGYVTEEGSVKYSDKKDVFEYFRKSAESLVGKYILLTNCDNVNFLTEGKTYEITGIDRNPHASYFEVDGEVGGIQYINIIPEASRYKYEIVDEPKAKFNAGDYVKVTKQAHEHQEGDVLEILEGTSNAFDYPVRNTRINPSNPGELTGFIDEENIELTEKPSETTFEVGSLAVISDTADSGKLSRGDVVEITEVGANQFDYRAKSLLNGLTEVFDEEELEAYVPEEKEINVGDKVVLAINKGEKPRHGFGSVITGDIGDVTSVVGEDFYADFENQSGWYGLSSEILVVEKAKEDSKFSVGEHALVIGGTRFADIKSGTTVKIVSELDEDGEYKIRLLDGSDYDFAVPGSLEKADKYNPEGIEKGDIVRSIEGEREGGIYEVEEVAPSGYIDAEQGVTLVGGGWKFTHRLEIVAKASDRKDL